MDVVIVGGGLTGLITGYYLSRKKHTITILEQENILGGAASCFDVNGQKIEKFYHHSLGSDYELFDFLEETGLRDKLEWKKAGVGFYCNGKIYNWGTPFDLLNFSPLNLFQKFRFGLSLLYISRIKNWKRLENIPMNQWLIKLSGQKVYKTIWEPMIKIKWGDHSENLPATWIWRRVKQRMDSRTKGLGSEKLGYIKGSTQTIIDFLERKIEENNGKIIKNNTVRKIITKKNKLIKIITEKGEFTPEAVISTLPLGSLVNIAPSLPDDYKKKLRDVGYLSVIEIVLVLKRSLSPVYWLNISDRNIPFCGIIEHTNFIPATLYNDKVIVYLPDYLSADNPLMEYDNEKIIDIFKEGLKRVFPDFSDDWILKSHVFREQNAHSIRTLNYSDRILDFKTPVENFYVATDALIYPQDRGMTVCAKLGKEVSALFPEIK